MFKEFKEFALKGNIVDLAIGIIIGGAFQSIVNSLVKDIIMPLINIFTGSMDFSSLVLKIGNSSIKYGSFITAVVNFLIIAFSLFLFVKYINKVNKKLEEAKIQESEKFAKLYHSILCNFDVDIVHVHHVRGMTLELFYEA